MKRALLMLGFALGLTACNANRGDHRIESAGFAPSLNPFIQQLSDSLHATAIGVAFYDFEDGTTYGYGDTLMFHAASTMKVPLMIQLFREIDAGRLALDDSIKIKNSFKSIVDQSEYAISDDSERTLYERIGEKASVRELISLMITWSSNLATNLLIELADAKQVTETMRRLGATQIQVLRGVEDLKAYRKGWNNRTSARDLMLILKAIAANTAASPTSCRQMIDILEQQHFTEGIGSGLPTGVQVASKSGAIQGIEHDAAIVFPPQRPPYILVVLTRGIADAKQAQQAIAAISKKVYELRILTPGK